MKDILVSILVPIYNVSDYLDRCLRTIFQQSYVNVEYVFVDDCSVDGSLQKLQELINTCYVSKKEKIKIIRHQKNEGIAVTRADLLKYAKGDYIQFVDSDDWIEPCMTEKMVEATDNGNADIVACDFYRNEVNGSEYVVHEGIETTCYENLLKVIRYDISPVLWRFLVRRSLFEDIHIPPHMDVGEDYAIVVKLLYYAKTIKAIDKPFYHYVQYNAPFRLSSQKMRCLNDHIKAVQEVERFLRDKDYLIQDVVENLNLRKFNIKSNFLNKETKDFKRFKKCFPEATRSWRKMGYSQKERLKFWLAEKNMFFVLNLIRK